MLLLLVPVHVMTLRVSVYYQSIRGLISLVPDSDPNSERPATDMAARINPDFISTQIRELFQIFWRCNHFRFIGSTRPRVESLAAMGASAQR